MCILLGGVQIRFKFVGFLDCEAGLVRGCDCILSLCKIKQAGFRIRQLFPVTLRLLREEVEHLRQTIHGQMFRDIELGQTVGDAVRLDGITVGIGNLHKASTADDADLQVGRQFRDRVRKTLVIVSR